MIRLAPALLLLLSACGEQATAPLLISDIVITEAIPGQTMSAGFMTLSNSSNEAIEISAVTSREFNSVAIHESSIEDGIARMRPIETLIIAAKSSVEPLSNSSVTSGCPVSFAWASSSLSTRYYLGSCFLT